jgi:hypothetical protein
MRRCFLVVVVVVFCRCFLLLLFFLLFLLGTLLDDDGDGFVFLLKVGFTFASFSSGSQRLLKVFFICQLLLLLSSIQ